MADAYRNTAGKVILNFGSTVVPAVKSWADLAGNLNVDQNCNQTCALNCVVPVEGHPLGLSLDKKCLKSCPCSYSIDDLTAAQKSELKANLKQDAGNAT